MANIRLKCLDGKFISFFELNKNFKCDKRYPEQAIHKFITLNQKNFAFLKLKAFIQEREGQIGIYIVSDKYIGSVPLQSPANGKHYADIELISRFSENVADVANLLQDYIEPEYNDMKLLDSNQMKAPVYLDCINYLNAFDKAVKYTWHRFDSIRINESIPSISTNWKQYVENIHDPNKVFVFNNSKSVQSKNHLEWYKLTYMAEYALELFLNPYTPIPLKCKVKMLINRMKSYTATHPTIIPNSLFVVNSFDPVKIKELKALANKILTHNSKNNLAWRLDSSILFERYVQYIIKKVAQKIGASSEFNIRFQLSGRNKPSWCLNYLEPDILLRKDGKIFFIDAKYKSHMFNKGDRIEGLKDTFRNDLHQILAYSSFDDSNNKVSMLVYPCSEYREIVLTARGGHINSRNKIVLAGLSLDTKDIGLMVSQLAAFFVRCE